MSGYFAPIPSQVPAGNKPHGKPEVVNVFAGRPALQLVNTPQDYLPRVPITTQLPFFWLAAGAQDKSDLTAAEDFRQIAETRQADVPFLIVPGGHQGSVWRAALGPMLAWMAPQLAVDAKTGTAQAAASAAASAGASTAAQPTASAAAVPASASSAPAKKPAPAAPKKK